MCSKSVFFNLFKLHGIIIDLYSLKSFALVPGLGKQILPVINVYPSYMTFETIPLLSQKHTDPSMNEYLLPFVDDCRKENIQTGFLVGQD